MKKVNTDILEKMAKEKNIDKDKIEKIADGYKGKSEGELMDELVKIGKTLEGKEQVVSKLKAFLNDDQKKKLDSVMNKIYDAEVKDKIENKKNKTQKNNSSSNSNIPSSNTKNVKKTKSTKHVPSTPNDNTNVANPHKKTKKVVKKVKKVSKGE